MIGLRRIEALRAILSTGSMTSAARILGTTQPNISRLVVELEAEVGFRVLRRHNRGVAPTEEGAMLHAEIERAFRGLADITRAAREIREFRKAPIRICAVSAPCLSVLPRMLQRWEIEFGQPKLILEFHDAVTVLHLVRSGRFDLGVISPVDEVSEVDVLMSKSFQYMLLAAAGTPLPESPVDLSVLNLPLVVPGATHLVGLCDDPEVAKAIVRRTQIDAYISMCAGLIAVNSSSVAIVDPFTARHLAATHGADTRTILKGPRYDIAVVAPAREQQPDMVATFAEMLVAEFRLD